MTIITNRSIVEAIATTLRTKFSGLVVQSPKEFTESIPQTPLTQVYFESGETGAGISSDRESFQRGLVVTSLVVVIDVYAKKRANIEQDIDAALDWIDKLDQWLLELPEPYFGVDAIKHLKWQWQRTLFSYSGNDAYSGARFTLTLTCY